MATPKVWRFYCQYTGENRQKKEESRLNMTSRLNRTLRREKGRKSKRGATNRERGPRPRDQEWPNCWVTLESG